MTKSYSEDEVQALVTAAVADATKELSTELDSFKSTQTAAEWEAKITEAKAELEQQIEQLKSELDTKVIEAEEAKKAHEGLVAQINEENEKVKLEAEVEARKADRVKAVSEAVPSFPETHLTENAERWAKMDDEAFEALLTDYKAVAEKATVVTSLPPLTALRATREDGVDKTTSAAKAVIRMREAGVDPRELLKRG